MILLPFSLSPHHPCAWHDIAWEPVEHIRPRSEDRGWVQRICFGYWTALGQPLINFTEKVPCEQTLLRSSYQNRKIEGDTARRELGKGFRLNGFVRKVFSKLKIIFDAVYSDVYACSVILGSYADKRKRLEKQLFESLRYLKPKLYAKNISF